MADATHALATYRKDRSYGLPTSSGKRVVYPYSRNPWRNCATGCTVVRRGTAGVERRSGIIGVVGACTGGRAAELDLDRSRVTRPSMAADRAGQGRCCPDRYTSTRACVHTRQRAKMQRQWTTVRGCWWYSLPSGGSTETVEALDQRKMKQSFFFPLLVMNKAYDPCVRSCTTRMLVVCWNINPIPIIVRSQTCCFPLLVRKEKGQGT